MKKLISMFLLAALLVACMAGCGSKTDAPAKDDASKSTVAASSGKVFGYVTQTLDNPYFISICDALRAGLNDGDELIVLDSVQDMNKELDNLNDLIARKVDLIFLSTCDAAGVVPTLNECKAAGIPVICVDTPLNDPSLVVTTVCSDNYAGGVLCAKALGDKLGGEGVVGAYIYSNNVVCGLRGQGFLDTMASDYPNIKVVTHDGGYPTVADAMPIMEDMLTANPDMAGIFAYNDPAAIGCSAAIKAAGLSDQVLVVGFDGSDEGIALMKTGEMYGSATQYPSQMGSQAIQLAYKYLSGESVENENFIDCGFIDVTTIS